MGIYETIKAEIIAAMKRGDAPSRDFARVVKAEFDRKGDGRPIPDGDAIRILKALRVVAEENHNGFELAFLDRYLPQELSEAEIEAWVRAHIDFSKYKVPLAAIGEITRGLGPAAPGDRVRAVVERLTSS